MRVQTPPSCTKLITKSSGKDKVLSWQITNPVLVRKPLSRWPWCTYERLFSPWAYSKAFPPDWISWCGQTEAIREIQVAISGWPPNWERYRNLIIAWHYNYREGRHMYKDRSSQVQDSGPFTADGDMQWGLDEDGIITRGIGPCIHTPYRKLKI